MCQADILVYDAACPQNRKRAPSGCDRDVFAHQAGWQVPYGLGVFACVHAVNLTGLRGG